MQGIIIEELIFNARFKIDFGANKTAKLDSHEFRVLEFPSGCSMNEESQSTHVEGNYF